MLMAFATLFSLVVCLFIYLRSDKSDTKPMLKRSGWVPVCAAICNLILNLMVILMASTDLSPSLIYPLIGVGGLSIVTVFSLVVFKEKMSRRQWLGVAIGAIAVVLLSL
jgi:drug/metabolite transporter (DMT)-like permease